VIDTILKWAVPGLLLAVLASQFLLFQMLVGLMAHLGIGRRD